MFPIITNYKKMFNSFIKNEFAETLGLNPENISAENFTKGDELADLKELQKALKDGKVDTEEAKIIKESINDIEGEAKNGLNEIVTNMLQDGFSAKDENSYNSFKNLIEANEGTKLPEWGDLTNANYGDTLNIIIKNKKIYVNAFGKDGETGKVQEEKSFDKDGKIIDDKTNGFINNSDKQYIEKNGLNKEGEISKTILKDNIQNVELKNKVKKLEGEITNLKTTINELKKSVKKKTISIRNLNLQITKLEGNITKLKTENKDLTETNLDLTTKITKLEGNIRELKEGNKNLTEQLNIKKIHNIVNPMTIDGVVIQEKEGVVHLRTKDRKHYTKFTINNPENKSLNTKKAITSWVERRKEKWGVNKVEQNPTPTKQEEIKEQATNTKDTQKENILLKDVIKVNGLDSIKYTLDSGDNVKKLNDGSWVIETEGDNLTISKNAREITDEKELIKLQFEKDLTREQVQEVIKLMKKIKDSTSTAFKPTDTVGSIPKISDEGKLINEYLEAMKPIDSLEDLEAINDSDTMKDFIDFQNEDFDKELYEEDVENIKNLNENADFSQLKEGEEVKLNIQTDTTKNNDEKYDVYITKDDYNKLTLRIDDGITDYLDTKKIIKVENMGHNRDFIIKEIKNILTKVGNEKVEKEKKEEQDSKNFQEKTKDSIFGGSKKRR